MVNIEAVNLTNWKISKKEITQTVKKIIKKLRREKVFSFLKIVDLSIAFIGEEDMKKINAKYKKINKPTDELSFLLAKTKNKLTGEILLCPKVIKTKNYGFQVSSFKSTTSSPTPFSIFAVLITKRIKSGERWRRWKRYCKINSKVKTQSLNLQLKSQNF